MLLVPKVRQNRLAGKKSQQPHKLFKASPVVSYEWGDKVLIYGCRGRRVKIPRLFAKIMTVVARERNVLKRRKKTFAKFWHSRLFRAGRGIIHPLSEECQGGYQVFYTLDIFGGSLALAFGQQPWIICDTWGLLIYGSFLFRDKGDKSDLFWTRSRV